MAFNQGQLRELITDVLEEANLYSPAAVELLMLTCAVESNLGTYIKQVRGPALGIFQMEPATHDDIHNNYIKYHDRGFFFSELLWPTTSEALRYNLKYAIIMTRIHYLRVPKPLPKADDIEGLAKYWKDHYNTYLGAGTVEKAVQKYKEYCT